MVQEQDNQKAQEVWRKIVETGTFLFRQFGTRTITMDEIAHQVGVSKKTLYLYFQDKDDLVSTVMEQSIQEIQAHCQKFQQQARDPIEEIILFMQYNDELFRNMNPVILIDLQKFHPKAFEEFQNHKNHFLQRHVLDNLKWGLREGWYRQGINLEIMSRFRMESAMLCFQPKVFPNTEFDMRIVQRELLEHYLYGIASPKGRELIEPYKKLYLNHP
ncbi:MAG: TetR/AcrR family transcriptional regulator [Chitinophagaceae bacterium]